MKTQTTRMMVALALSMLSLTACQKNDGETAIGRDRTAANNIWAQGAGITLNGNVTSSDAQDLFREAVLDLVEPLCAEISGCNRDTWVGYVSPQANGTGVFLGGRVEMQSGVLNPNSSTVMSIRTDSKLYAVIYDEFSGRPDASGQVVPYVSRAFTSATGQVQGNRATLCFADKYGIVQMEGTFNGQNFYGVFHYDTGIKNCSQVNQQPIGGHAGDLGQFHVPTCQFFRCQ